MRVGGFEEQLIWSGAASIYKNVIVKLGVLSGHFKRRQSLSLTIGRAVGEIVTKSCNISLEQMLLAAYARAERALNAFIADQMIRKMRGAGKSTPPILPAPVRQRSVYMIHDFNFELHARPSMHIEGPAFVEHIALLPTMPRHREVDHIATPSVDAAKTQVNIEHHTEFVTVTRVTSLDAAPVSWPDLETSEEELAGLAGERDARVVCKLGFLILNDMPTEIIDTLDRFAFDDTAASFIGDGAAVVCSDFRVGSDLASRILMFNKSLNQYRLGRMVRRVCEIETYRSMALLALPEARRLAPVLVQYDATLVNLTDRNARTVRTGHRQLLDEISSLSAEIIKATARTRNRFGATTAYAKIVEERISELRETHVPGFQRFGMFVARRFRPAVRSCEATALRLEQLSHATMHLIDLLQTQIQVEIEFQNATQIQAVADRAATQLKIQRAVEGFSIIAISYYLLSLLKVAGESLDHAGYHIDPLAMLVSIPIVVAAVILSILRVKHALKAEA